MLFLSEHEVDLWFTRPGDCQDASLQEQYRRLMDEGETQEWLRYRVEKKRHEHLAARALVRTVLSQYAPIPPEAWRFVRSPTGKPAIDWAQVKTRLSNIPSEAADLEFNLSHTDGMILCAVTRGAAVGVDVEDACRPVEFLPLARRFFAPAEIALLENLPPDQVPHTFYRLWTLKEAYLKAQGAGLTTALESFSFHWPRGFSPELPSYTFDPFGTGRLEEIAPNAPRLAPFSPVGGDPNHWQFREIFLEGRFQAALAVARSPEFPLRITLRKALPP